MAVTVGDAASVQFFLCESEPLLSNAKSVFFFFLSTFGNAGFSENESPFITPDKITACTDWQPAPPLRLLAVIGADQQRQEINSLLEMRW